MFQVEVWATFFSYYVGWNYIFSKIPYWCVRVNLNINNHTNDKAKFKKNILFTREEETNLLLKG